MKKKCLFIFINLLISSIIAYNLFSSVTSVTLYRVGYDGQYVEADTQNNPVLHMKINADSNGDTLTYLGVYNILDSWYIGSALEPDSLNNVKLWYSPVDSSNFSESSYQYITTLPTDGGDWWYSNLNLFVQDGSSIWITVDIPLYPSGGTIEFQTESLTFLNSSVNSMDEPSNPSVMLITQSTPAKNLEVYHIGGTMQSYVSTSQSNIIPMELQFFNNSGDNSAPIVVSGITITVKTYSPLGNTLTPKDILNSIKIQDKNTGTIYGEVGRNSLPATPSPIEIPISLLNIPANTTITTNVVIEMTDNTSFAGTNFVLSIDDPAYINAYDYYTQKEVSIYASPIDATGFPLYSNFATLQKRCEKINMDYTDIIPPNINKGETNVNLLKFHFTNPGDTLTSSAEIYNIKLYLKDNNDSPITPSSLFSKIVITDESGGVTYGLKTSDNIETSGNIINFALLNTIGISSPSTITVVVKADISTSTNVNNFKIGIDSVSDISARDKNSFISLSVTTSTIPFYSSLALLTSSFKVSHLPKLPQNIYGGDKNIEAMDIILSSPLSFGNGNILLTGITLTAKDKNNSNINFSTFLDKITFIYDNDNKSFIVTPIDSSTLYCNFPSPLTISPSEEKMVKIFIDVKQKTASKNFQIFINSSSDINAYQDNEPEREIFIATDSNDTFPMGSGIGFIFGDTNNFSLSAYPSPFIKGQNIKLSFYIIDTSTINLSIFDLSGRLIKTIIKDDSLKKGSYIKYWDGKDNNNKFVLSGTYIVQLLIKNNNSIEKLRQKITFIKR